MTTVVDRFSEYLTDIELPKNQNSLWQVAGLIKDRTNVKYKFDVRDMIIRGNNTFEKHFSSKSNADKVVFETGNKWVIFDVKEILDFINKNKTKILHIEDLISKLEWNIVLPKK